jgi:hypothetical protein
VAKGNAKTLRSVDLGCITQNVLTMHLALPDARYHAPMQKAQFFERLIAEVRRLRGVQKAGLVTVLPGEGHGGDNLFTIVEHPLFPQGEMQDALRRAAEPGYFEAMGIPLLRGRTFFEGERLDRATSVIVSDLFVRRFLREEDPIGRAHTGKRGRCAERLCNRRSGGRFTLCDVEARRPDDVLSPL